MFDCRNGRLHHEQVRPGFLGDASEPLRLLRNGTDGGQHPPGLQLADTLGDQLLLDRFGVELLDQRGDVLLADFDDLIQDFGGIGVAGLYAFQIDHSHAAQFAHFDAKGDVGDAVHGAGDDRNFKFDATAVLARDFE